MKFGQFMPYSKRNNFFKKLDKNCDVKTSFRSFCVCEELSTTSEEIYLYLICNSKAVEISTNQHAGLIRFLFTEDSLKIKQGLELASRPHS